MAWDTTVEPVARSQSILPPVSFLMTEKSQMSARTV